MKTLLRHKGIWIVAAALSLTLLFVALSYMLAGREGPLSQVAQTVVSPFDRAANFVEQNVSHLYGQATQYEQLRLENESLRTRLAAQEDAVRDGTLALQENTRLRQLLGFAEGRKDLQFSPAKVLSFDASNWSRSLRIDQGSRDGVKARDCVVDASGRLVGIVKEVGEFSATVTLVTDATFELGGEGVAAEERGILCGDLALMQDGLLKLSNLPRDTKLAPGDEVISFATEGLYPSGLTVGTVERISSDPGGLYAYATVKPAAKLERLYQVFLVTAFEKTNPDMAQDQS